MNSPSQRPVPQGCCVHERLRSHGPRGKVRSIWVVKEKLNSENVGKIGGSNPPTANIVPVEEIISVNSLTGESAANMRVEATRPRIRLSDPNALIRVELGEKLTMSDQQLQVSGGEQYQRGPSSECYFTGTYRRSEKMGCRYHPSSRGFHGSDIQGRLSKAVAGENNSPYRGTLQSQERLRSIYEKNEKEMGNYRIQNRKVTSVCNGEDSWSKGFATESSACRSRLLDDRRGSIRPLKLEKQLMTLEHSSAILRDKDRGLEPLSCPICMEVLDETDSSFSSCSCRFKLCLFCYHTIATKDGRCPGCRKSYDSKLNKSSDSKVSR